MCLVLPRNVVSVDDTIQTLNVFVLFMSEFVSILFGDTE